MGRINRSFFYTYWIRWSCNRRGCKRPGDLKKWFTLFASGRTAAGPTKGGGGKVDIPISCGNVALKPGDIIIGDDDGVAVIPFEIQNQILLSSEEKIIYEKQIIKKIKDGNTHKDIFDIKDIPIVNDDN